MGIGCMLKNKRGKKRATKGNRKLHKRQTQKQNYSNNFIRYIKYNC